MAAAPVYMTSPFTGYAEISAANTGRDGSGANLVVPTWDYGGSSSTTAPASAWQLKRIFIGGTGDVADSVVTMFTVNSATSAIKFLWDYDVGNPTAASTTSPGHLFEVPFVECLFGAGVNVSFGVTVIPVSGVVTVNLFCERA